MEKLTNVMALTMAIELAENSANAELVEKLTKIKTSFEKKNSAERKPTATQVENVALKDAIVEFLDNAEGKAYTVSELMKFVDVLADMSNQKVSALVRALVNDGIVIRIEEKRKAYFKLA